MANALPDFKSTCIRLRRWVNLSQQKWVNLSQRYSYRDEWAQMVNFEPYESQNRRVNVRFPRNGKVCVSMRSQ